MQFSIGRKTELQEACGRPTSSLITAWALPEDGAGDGRLRCDFSKRDSAHKRAHNAACSHQSCTLCPVFETTCNELNDALVAVVGNWPHLRVRVAEFGPNHSQRAKVAVLLPNPFDALVLYTTQAALDEIAYAHRAPLVQQLVWPLGAFDSVVHHLAAPPGFAGATPSRFEDLSGPRLASPELSFCLLVWRRKNVGSPVSVWGLVSADAKSSGAIGGSSGWRYRPPAGRGSM